ncbi:MAG: glycosyltransferase, partial [Cyanobacteria bacterium P01_A01_bin.68]
KQKVIQMGLRDKVIFAGVRSDIAQLMMGAMDAFVFPSLYEGLGLVLIEAQAAGLPCILSDVIPEEADVVKPLMKRISLLQPAYSWAEAILATRKTEKNITQKQALKCIEESSFNIQNSLKYLENLYVEESNVLCP